ncbi:methyltransferase family protein [Alkalibacterium subtropicum]|nr:isoprenylcysteine carboxylmethyltransferase family protein [Alkalibacterium subtropicum]
MEMYIFLALNKNTNKENTEKKSKYIVLALILFGMIGSFLFDQSVGAAFGLPFRGWRYLSIPLILTGVLVRFSAIRQLGSSFSVNVGVQKGTELEQDGLYKFIRHPSYTGEIIIFLGVSIAFFHPVSSLFAFVFPTSAILYRIHTEEKVLLTSFGEEYKKYQKRTKKIIPFIY